MRSNRLTHWLDSFGDCHAALSSLHQPTRGNQILVPDNILLPCMFIYLLWSHKKLTKKMTRLDFILCIINSDEKVETGQKRGSCSIILRGDTVWFTSVLTPFHFVIPALNQSTVKWSCTNTFAAHTDGLLDLFPDSSQWEDKFQRSSPFEFMLKRISAIKNHLVGLFCFQTKDPPFQVVWLFSSHQSSVAFTPARTGWDEKRGNNYTC